MAYIISLVECISILLFTVKLLVRHTHVSRNPFTLLDCIGRMGRRCEFSLHVKLIPLQLLKLTVSNKFKQSRPPTFIDGNCTVLVHASHLMRLRMVSGNWVKVTFLFDDIKKRDPCVRWIRLYGVSKIAKGNCYLSSCLHNNLNTTSASDDLSMILSDTLPEVLLKKEVQTYYMGVIVPKFLNFCLIPCSASTVHLSVIEHPDYGSGIDFEQTMSDYFENSRLICTGDILVLNIQDAQLGGNALTIHQGSYIYCCVTKISCTKSCTNCVCHLTQGNKTKLILIGSSQSRRIPCSDSLIDAEGNISIPPHLEKEFISIKKIMKEHFHSIGDTSSVTTNKHLSIISESPDSKQNLGKESNLSTHLPFKQTIRSIREHHALEKKTHAVSKSSNSEKSNVISAPSANSCLHGHVLLQGRAADVELLLHYLRGSSGYCFYTIKCWKLKAETSGATEAKVLQAMQRSKALEPAVFVLEGVDILVKTAQGEEDVRVTAALSHGLLHLSSRSVLVLATCEGHSIDNNTMTTAAVPGGLWRLFSYQVQLPVSLGAVHREKLSRWFLLNKYSDFVEHTNSFNTQKKSHPETSELLYEELISLLTHRTVGYTYPAIDAALHMACSSCASEFEEQNEPDLIPMVDDETTQSEGDQESSNNAEFGRRKNSITGQSNSALGCCDHPLLLPRHLSTALDSLSHQRKPGGAASVPQVHWRDVGALETAKRELVNAVLLPLRFPHLVTAGMRRAGVLLYGPPGTGKTLLAKAVASECGLNFLSVKGPELLSMYVGQSELNVRQVFQRARSAAPCVIFFDELDALTPSRGAAGDSGGVMDRVVSAVVAELDECSSSGGDDDEGGAVFVLAATNRPDLLDPALLRPGRFEKLVYLGPCSDHASLLGILRAATAKLPLCPVARLEAVVQQLPPRLTGADLAAVATEAFYSALRRTVAEIERGSVSASDARVMVTEADLLSAAADAVPSVSAQQLAQYETYTAATSTTSAG